MSAFRIQLEILGNFVCQTIISLARSRSTKQSRYSYERQVRRLRQIYNTQVAGLAHAGRGQTNSQLPEELRPQVLQYWR